jgi:hypothetical protein
VASLPDDLLQFPGARGAITHVIVVGFDFGTSSSKVVLQSPFALAGRVMATCFPRSLAHHSCSMLLPTVLHEDAAGRLSLAEVEGRRHRSLKVALLSASGVAPAAEARAAAYLGLALRQVREYFLTTQRDYYGAAQIRWQLNVGVPSAGYDDEVIRERFLRVAATGWALSLLATPLTADAAADALSATRNDIDIAVVPEIVAEVIGYARSLQRRPGLHLVFDVGASTLDVCSFSLHDTQGEDGWALLTADVQPLGLLDLHHRRMNAAGHQPPFDDFPDDLVGPLPDWWRYNFPSDLSKKMKRCEAQYVEAAERVLMRSLLDLRRTRDPHSPHWKEGLPVFVCGGGAAAGVADELFAAVHAKARGLLANVGGLKRLSVQLPPMAVEPVPVNRMAVAYGLSFQAADIGLIDPPGSVEDVVAPSPARGTAWRDSFVSKDQV